jgi:FemAB-related protein (PEP-CTERM system-associated)
MRVEEAQASDAAWDEYVAAHPDATGYHMMGWRLVIEQTFGDGAVYLVAKDDRDAITGVLPMVFFASRLFGRFLVSLPYVNYGGILADTPTARMMLLVAAEDRARSLRAKFIELRHQAELDFGWPKRQHKVSMRLELPQGFDTLWKNFPSKLRSQIRRAQKEGMNIRFGGEEILHNFYQVFSRNMRDLGTPVPTCKFFFGLSSNSTVMHESQ